MTNVPPQIFSTKRRMALRARALRLDVGDSFLLNHMADELAERLAFVSRTFENALLIGPIAMLAERILAERKTAIVADLMLNEEALPYPPESFDLIISAGTLDSVNDLPGALVQIRRTLKPDGLFLGTLYGAGSLSQLKAAMLLADGERVQPHIHPQIDLRAISDLMARAAFALPVTDIDMLTLRYADWRGLVNDLRAAGAGNAMAIYNGFDRQLPKNLDRAWANLADPDGRSSETIALLHLNGWAPSPDQPKPAPRGSGKVSLADVLKKTKG
jgi:NADH dehydrogenase [ubiquinone] 1 alpha subcomplex assembly factor 5